MKYKFMIRIITGLTAAIVLIALSGWLTFVPSAKQPGYKFIGA